MRYCPKGENVKILVISGFLGAGKTTFIKELIRRTGKNIVVMGRDSSLPFLTTPLFEREWTE